MNKLKIKLYVTLFIVSMLFSATTNAIVFAQDNMKNADTVVTYVQPATEEIKSVYEVNIPSTATFETGKNSMIMTFSLSQDSVLADNYVVHLDIDPKTFSTIDGKNNFFVMYTPDKKYYRAHVLGNSKSTFYYNSSNDQNLSIATFSNLETYTSGGTLILYYSGEKSNDIENTDGGTYTGTLYFNIYGSTSN